jgi:hypothetical protein
MGGKTMEYSLERLWMDLREHLQRTGESLNLEIRGYPTPIAACDEQLTELLERRTMVLDGLRRMDALATSGASPHDKLAVIEMFITSRGYTRDEVEADLKAHLADGVRTLCG